MPYSCLEQRMTHAYLAMFPAFHPKENAEVSVQEQKAFYDLMQRLYQLLYEDPSYIVPTLNEDDAYLSRYKKSYGKPELDLKVLKIKNAVEKLLKNMFLLGQGSEVKLSRRHLQLLSLAGVGDVRDLPPAWRWMSSRPGADPVSFAYCLFDEAHVYALDVYARLLGGEPFGKLTRWLRAQGYVPYDTYNTEWPDYQLKLNFANPAWSKEPPRGGNEYKVRHTGISVQYDAYVREPVSLGLCIPGGLKLFLEHFDSMPEQVQDFVLARTKVCDGCRYCVQTDRTGARPLARVPVRRGETSYLLCPYYPGYSYSWSRIDDALIENLTAMLSFMDGFADRPGAAK
jgi:hypothetical protein